MKAFLKENFALVTGIALPLILITAFYIAGQISKNSADDPHYDFLYVAPYHNNHHYRFDVEEGRLQITDIKPQTDKNVRNYYNSNPSLHIFDHETLSSREVAVDWDNTEDNLVIDEAIVEINRKYEINTANKSPDGYEYQDIYRPQRGLFGGLFGYGSRRQHAIKKNNRIIPLDNKHYNIYFIGWMIGKDND